ncbi:hypothetical protein ETD83_10910 [Actinomadura soli]|uniref:Uncharacterized protein n=1 Tax=Actinomadura soli TaxID=2508997 RepID=A0A5C4JEK8_9ACTN|nr:hypothetical protein [Actinomadura soli]TMR03408.1 hypothetical protein ETD83_10910 [Actinomadura soli]
MHSLTTAVTPSLFGLATVRSGRPSRYLPRRGSPTGTASAVGDHHPRAEEFQEHGWSAAALPFLAAHLLEVAEQVPDQPDLPPDSRDHEQLQYLAGVLLHEVAEQITRLAPVAQAAFAVAEVFEDTPRA